MKWKTPTLQPVPQEGEKQTRFIFALVPHKCEDGFTRWLETIQVYDHIQDDTETQCPLTFSRINQADGTTLPPPFDEKPIDGWTSYKFHTKVVHPPEAKNSIDMWDSWRKTIDVIERVAYLKGLTQGLTIGFLIGVLGTLIFLAWAR